MVLDSWPASDRAHASFSVPATKGSVPLSPVPVHDSYEQLCASQSTLMLDDSSQMSSCMGMGRAQSMPAAIAPDKSMSLMPLLPSRTACSRLCHISVV